MPSKTKTVIERQGFCFSLNEAKDIMLKHIYENYLSEVDKHRLKEFTFDEESGVWLIFERTADFNK